MPFVRIDLRRGKSADYRKALGDIVYQAMRDVINVPENDKFQVITEHGPITSHRPRHRRRRSRHRRGFRQRADHRAGAAPIPGRATFRSKCRTPTSSCRRRPTTALWQT